MLVSLVTTILILLATPALKAQRYGVQSQIIIGQPTVYLPDYYSPGSMALQVSLRLLDLNKPVYAVRLVLKIEGLGNGIVLETLPSAAIAPVELAPFVTTLLAGSDLAQYFEPANLSIRGISRDRYDRSRTLPAGNYTFTVTAYDANRPDRVQVSNAAFTMRRIQLASPPEPLVPANRGVVNTAFVNFLWTAPVGLGMLTSPPEYRLEIYELLDPARPAEAEVAASRPLIVRTAAMGTTYPFNVLMESPQLIEGRTYAWRVQATFPDGRAIVDRNGYSRVNTFVYNTGTGALGRPAGLQAQAESQRVITASWDAVTGREVPDGYRLEYRKTGNSSYEWFAEETTDTRATVRRLEPSTEYELRVQSVAGGYRGDYSNTVTIRTPDPKVYDCDTPENTDTIITNFEPLMSLMAGDYFYNDNGYEFRVLRVSNSTGGVFDGACVVTIPWLGGTFAANYTGIRLNTDYRMLDGMVALIEDNLDAWIAANKEAETDSATATTDTPNTPGTVLPPADTTITIAGTIDTVYYTPDGDLLVITEEGETTTIDASDIPEGTTVAVTDGAGNGYVAAGGEVTPASNPVATNPESNVSNDSIVFVYNKTEYLPGDTIFVSNTVEQVFINIKGSADLNSDIVWEGAEGEGKKAKVEIEEDLVTASATVGSETYTINTTKKDIDRIRFEPGAGVQTNQFDENDPYTCNLYPTYKNTLGEGSRYVYVKPGATTNMEATVVPRAAISYVKLTGSEHISSLKTIPNPVSKNPLLFNFMAAIGGETQNTIKAHQDSVKGRYINGLNVINCQQKTINISVYLLLDSKRKNPPTIKQGDIETYLNRIYDPINVQIKLSVKTVAIDYEKVFDLNKNGKLDRKTEEDNKILSFRPNANNEFKIYVIDDAIYREGLDPDKSVGGYTRISGQFPNINPIPVIISTHNNPKIEATFAHEIGHNVFRLPEAWDDSAVPDFAQGHDEFNIMDYVESLSFPHNERKLRAYQVIQIQNGLNNTGK